MHALCPLLPVLQALADQKEQHRKDLAAAARRHEEAVQVQQMEAKKQLAEQGRAVANAEKAVRDAIDASKQASQVPHLEPWMRVVAVHLCKSSRSNHPPPHSTANTLYSAGLLVMLPHCCLPLPDAVSFGSEAI